MKVRTRLEINAILPVFLSVVISLILIRISSQMNEVILTIRAADGVVMELFRLNAATYGYRAAPSSDAKERWMDAYTSLGMLLIRESAVNLGESKLLEDLRDTHEEMRQIFVQLDELRSGTPVSGAAAVGASKQEEKLYDRLHEYSHSMVGKASTLAAVGHSKALAVQERAYMLIIATSTILAAILAVSSIWLSRAVSGSITALHDGTRLASGGQLDHRVNVRSNDELGDLATAFNSMLGELKGSREKIRAQMDECEQTSRELRVSNERLTSAMDRLQRAQSEAVSQERLHALRQVSRGIVHDINDALMPVLGLSEFFVMYPDKLTNTEQVGESMKGIHHAASRATKVVRHLSEFFYPTDMVQSKELELSKVIEDALLMIAPMVADMDAAGNGIKIEKALAAMPPFETNVTELREILTDLLLNCLEAMPDGGTIRLSARSEEGSVVIEVSDTGKGMESGVKDRCFEPFFSTKEKRHSGMGLTAARAVVSRANGSVEIESEPDKGTTVTLRLPIKAVSVSRKQESKEGPGNLRILTVDDVSWVTLVLKWNLEAQGHTVDTCARGEEAIEKIRSTRYDLVIADRSMPDVSGDEIAAAVKKVHADTPVIILTGFGDVTMAEQERPECVDLVLTKPITNDELAAAIQGLFG